MKKRFLMLLSFLLLGGVFVFGQIDLNVAIDDSTPILPGQGKSPISVPEVWLDNHQLTFEASHDDYTLELLDADGMVIYSTYVPSATTIVNLPAWLEGEYEIRLYGNTYYFYGYIEL